MAIGHTKASDIGIFLFGCFVCASTILLHKLNKELFWTLAAWEGFNSIKFFEMLQFLFYSAAFIFSILTLWNFRSRPVSIQIKLVILFFSIGVALLALEEISYGQKFLPIKTPKFLEHFNVQNEITIHNISFIQPHLTKGYFLISLAGGFGFVVKSCLPKTRTLDYFLVDWCAAPCFALCLSIIAYARLVRPEIWPSIVVFHETFELLIASGLLSVSTANYLRSKQ